MKTLNAKGKTQKQIDKQVKRWLSKNPNRNNVQVITDNGLMTIKTKKSRAERHFEESQNIRQKLATALGCPERVELNKLTPEQKENVLDQIV